MTILVLIAVYALLLPIWILAPLLLRLKFIGKPLTPLFAWMVSLANTSLLATLCLWLYHPLEDLGKQPLPFFLSVLIVAMRSTMPLWKLWALSVWAGAWILKYGHKGRGLGSGYVPSRQVRWGWVLLVAFAIATSTAADNGGFSGALYKGGFSAGKLGTFLKMPNVGRWLEFSDFRDKVDAICRAEYDKICIEGFNDGFTKRHGIQPAQNFELWREELPSCEAGWRSAAKASLVAAGLGENSVEMCRFGYGTRTINSDELEMNWLRLMLMIAVITFACIIWERRLRSRN